MGYMNLNLARSALAEAKLDALLLLSPRYFTYATGHSSWYLNLYGEAGYGAAVIPVDSSIAPGVLVSDVEEGPVRATAPGFAQVVTYPVWIAYGDVPPLVTGDAFAHLATHDTDQPTVRTGQVDWRLAMTRLVGLLRAMGLTSGRIGTELTFVTGPALTLLQEALPHCTFVEVTPLLDRLRAYKSPHEAALLRRGTQLAEAGIEAVMAAIQPGMTAREIARRYRLAIFGVAGENGGDVLSARITLRVGPHVLEPQSSGNYAVQPGDLVFMDCGVEVSSYWADMGRCFVLGQATPIQRQIYAALRAGFDAATALLHIGNTPAQVFTAGLDAVHATGMTSYVRGNLGHGIGMDRAPELPIISREETMTLAPGQVISVEFPYYIQGIGALQLEDTFYLTTEGREVFNRLPHELLEVG